jgi:hypothetical protein
MKHLGLDFGTSTTIFSNFQGVFQLFGSNEVVIPSLAGRLEQSGEFVYGADALEQIAPAKLIRSMKVAISSNLSELKTVDGEDSFPADDIIIGFLKHLKLQVKRDQSYRDLAIRMSCPALWSKSQRLRLISCATAAGIELEQGVLLDEPVAAAIGWIENLPISQRPSGRVLVFDMGGGTLDLAVVELDKNSATYQVRSTWGSEFAGNAFDSQLADYIIRKSNIIELVNEEIGKTDLAAFRQFCKNLKERLTVEERVTESVTLPRSRTSFEVDITRTELQSQLALFFSQHVWSEVGQVLKLLHTNLKSFEERETLDQIARLPWSELADSFDFVLLAGGMTKIPFLEQILLDGPQDSAGLQTKVFHPGADVNREFLVSQGLGQLAQFENININRPDFDLYLEWLDGVSGARTEFLLWEAYSELVNTGGYDFRNAAGFISFDRGIVVPPESKPRDWSGKIIARSITGELLNFDAGDRSGNFLPYDFYPDGRDGHFKLFPDGYFRIRNETGHTRSGQMASWPKARIKLEPPSWPQQNLSWYNEPYK